MTATPRFTPAALKGLVTFKTGKLDSNASTADGDYPFFTCSRETFRTGSYSFDDRAVLLAGNNASGDFPIKYFEGKFDAYQRTYVIRPVDAEELEVRYLYFALSLQLANMKRLSTGSATKFLTMGILHSLEIPLPKYPTQRRIASILSAYDDLIENNTKRIEILEEMARSLYREWFVHFRFPGHEKVRLVDSELGKIPEGWRVTTLNKLLSALESGKRPKGGVGDLAEGVPSVGAENVKGIGRHDFEKEKYVSEAFFQTLGKGVVRNGDVGLYKDGAYIGRSTYFRGGFPHMRMCVNEHVFLLRPSNGFTANVLYLWLSSDETVAKVRSTNANAAQPGINQKGVKHLKVCLPTKVLVGKLDEIVEPMLGSIANLAKRNRVLRQTRDLLLPKLISGEIDVDALDLPEAT